MSAQNLCAVVTGASSGIGAAAARLLAAQGYRVILGARRLERLQVLATELGGEAILLDVTDAASVAAFAAQLPLGIDVLVNNAGGALGLESLANLNEAHWQDMWQSNVLGLARMTKALYPNLLRAFSGIGHVVNIGSVAAHETYVGGGGYTACKHAVRAITETMRAEWLGQPLRVTEIDPGLVETEFSLVRFDGDAERALSGCAQRSSLHHPRRRAGAALSADGTLADARSHGGVDGPHPELHR